MHNGSMEADSLDDALKTYVRRTEGLNEAVGRTVAWFVFGAVLVAFAVVVLRKVFNIGLIWMQDVYVAQHAVAFMLGAGYTMLHGGHVRVDIFYQEASARRRAWVDIFGTLVFLLPWLLVVTWMSVPFVERSWSLFERALQPGGLPGVFVLKTVILVFAALLAVQGTALLARSVLVLRGHEEYSPRGGL